MESQMYDNFFLKFDGILVDHRSLSTDIHINLLTFSGKKRDFQF